MSTADPTHDYLRTAARQYERQKQALLHTEAEAAWDRKARDAASPAQRRAASIIWCIREDERDNLYGNMASEALPSSDTLDMGGQLLTNKARTVTQSILYKIAHRLPKGGHLHIHFNANLVPDELVEKARQKPNMFIRSTQPLLTDRDFDSTELVFSVLPMSTVEADIFSPRYNPEFRSAGAMPWMRWIDFRTRFATERNMSAEEWIMSKMVLSEEEVYGKDQTTNG
jgi:adenosine deaminase CECR1